MSEDFDPGASSSEMASPMSAPSPSKRKKIKLERSSSSKKSRPAKCCGNVGCAKACLGKVSKPVRKKLKQTVKDAVDDDPELAYKLILQFMSGNEIHNFGEKSQHRKKVWWTYFLPAAIPNTEDIIMNADEIERVEVCQRAFLEVFGVNERFIRTARDNQSRLLRGEKIKTKRKKTIKKKNIDLQEAENMRTTAMLNLKSMHNWASFEINDETLQGLVNEGFTSLLAISSIREDDLKYLKRNSGISQGQVALLRQAVDAISNTTINACKALAQALSTDSSPQQQEQANLEVHFETSGQLEATIETSSNNADGAGTSGENVHAILECREGSVSPEAGPSQVKVIPCAIRMNDSSSSSSGSSSSGSDSN